VPRVEPAAAVCRALLDLMGRVLDALAVVDDILEANSSIPADGYGPDKDESHLRSALRCVQELGPEWNAEAIETACAELRSALDDGEDGSRQAVERIKDAVLPPLATAAVELDNGATLGGRVIEDLDQFGGDLTAMVEDASPPSVNGAMALRAS